MDQVQPIGCPYGGLGRKWFICAAKGMTMQCSSLQSATSALIAPQSGGQCLQGSPVYSLDVHGAVFLAERFVHSRKHGPPHQNSASEGAGLPPAVLPAQTAGPCSALQGHSLPVHSFRGCVHSSPATHGLTIQPLIDAPACHTNGHQEESVFPFCAFVAVDRTLATIQCRWPPVQYPSRSRCSIHNVTFSAPGHTQSRLNPRSFLSIIQFANLCYFKSPINRKHGFQLQKPQKPTEQRINKGADIDVAQQ